MVSRAWSFFSRVYGFHRYVLIQFLVLIALIRCSEEIILEPTPVTRSATRVSVDEGTPTPAATTETPATVTRTPTPAPTPISSPGGPGVATNLQAQPSCDEENPRQGLVTLSWTVASPPGTAQRVDVSIRGFEPGNFMSSDPLPAEQNSLIWNRLHGQAIHSWRLLTLREEGWIASEIARFEGPTCVADFQP